MRIKAIGIWALMFSFSLFLLAPCASADEKDYSNEPWEKAALYLGAFVIDTTSDLTLGAGVKVDGEDALGLEENFTAFRADGFWRITRRNRVDFSFYEMNRSGSSFLGVEIPDGEGGSWVVGTRELGEFWQDAVLLRLGTAQE